MSKDRLTKKDKNDRLSSFGERLQSLSELFYSTILEDSNDNKVKIKNSKELEDLQSCQNEDFTFDQCSTSQLTSNDNFSFTFHSIDQNKTQTIEKYQKREINRSSTPCSVRHEKSLKEAEDETIFIEKSPENQAIIVGYYPVISYQPICFPPTIYLSKQQIERQLNNISIRNKN